MAGSSATVTIDERTPLISPAISPRTIPYAGEDDVEAIPSSDEDSIRKDEAPAGISPILIVLILTVAVFIGQLDTSFVLATHGNISSEFNHLQDSGWIVTSYALASCAVQPIYGKASDIFGRKSSIIFAYICFGLGTLISGTASSFNGVVLGRVLAGIGGAGSYSLVSLIILDLFPIRQVASLRSYVNIIATTGRSLGGPIGGFLADTIGWRWSFIIQTPLLAISSILVWVMVPKKESPVENTSESTRAKIARIDFAGSLLFAGTILSAIFPFEIGGTKVPWNHPIIYGFAASFFIFGGLFVATEKYWAAEPVFPLHLLGNRDLLCGYLLMLLQCAAQLGLMYCVPLYFQITQHASSSRAGAHLIPAVVGNAIGAIIAGFIIKKTGRYKIIAVIATLVGASAYALLIVRWQGDTNFWESWYILPGGAGMGLMEAAVFISLSAAVKPEMQAIALSGLFLSGSIGVVTGLSGMSAVLERFLKRELETRLADYPKKDKIIRRAMADIKYIWTVDNPLRGEIIASYVKGLEATHAVSLGLVGLAFIAAISLRQRKL